MRTSMSDVKSGFPQGAMPGPMLFIIIIKDVRDALKCTVRSLQMTVNYFMFLKFQYINYNNNNRNYKYGKFIQTNKVTLVP